MLCQHLGFNETDYFRSDRFRSSPDFATGDLICYNTQDSGTSCCTHLVPSTNNLVRITHVRCEYDLRVARIKWAKIKRIEIQPVNSM